MAVAELTKEAIVLELKERFPVTKHDELTAGKPLKGLKDQILVYIALRKNSDKWMLVPEVAKKAGLPPGRTHAALGRLKHHREAVRSKPCEKINGKVASRWRVNITKEEEGLKRG